MNVTIGAAVRGDWKPGAAPTPTVTGPDRPYVEVTGDSVYVRMGPDTTYGAMGVAHKGDRLRYFGYTYTNDWALVEYAGQTAWISRKFTKIVE